MQGKDPGKGSGSFRKKEEREERMDFNGKYK
jgi:hypothetical protein